MKCNKCEFENTNDAVFCVNCGNKLIKKYGQINNNQIKNSQKSKKNKKTRLILIGVLIVIVVSIIAIYIYLNKSNKFEDPFDDINTLVSSDIHKFQNKIDESNSFTKKIEEDYKNKQLTKDEYLMQLAYSIYDYNKLDLKYKSTNIDFNEPNNLFEKFESMVNELNDDTIKYIFEKYTLSHVDWNVEEDSNVKDLSSNIVDKNNYEIKNVVDKNGDVSKLDNVKLSSNSNFLIYYTKEGENAITDEQANKIATFLEFAVSEYKTKFNLDYKYEAQYEFWSASSMTKEGSSGSGKWKACQLLKKNNIDIKFLDTAMPVYIIDTDTENTGVLGYYSQPLGVMLELVTKVLNIFGDDGIQIDNMTTTYSFPFFVVSSDLDDFDDTKIVLAHELFHHYQKYISGDGKYGDCTSGNFTVETTADQAAIQVADVNKIGTVINEHAGSYIKDIESSIDKIGYKDNGDSGLGYGAYVFATNYSNMISNGAENMFNSIKNENPLKFIYDNSNGKYKDVLLDTAEKNLTLDYNNKLLIGNDDGKVIYPQNHKDIGKNNIKQTEKINYSSMHYYYINPNDYGKKSQLSFNSSYKNLTLLLFIKENSKYKYLYTHNLDKEFVININDFSAYDEVVFALVESSISGLAAYNYELNNNGIKTPTVTAKSLKLKTFEEKIEEYSSFIFNNLEEDDEYKTITQIKLSFDENDKINDMYFKSTIEAKNYNPNDPSFAITQKLISGTLFVMKHVYKKQFKYYKVTTKEETCKYSVTFKILKNYYDALNNSLEINAKSKADIIKSIQEKGYVCQYLN